MNSKQAGTRVSILATHTTAGEASTRVSVADAVVVHYDPGETGFAASDTGVLTVALASTDDHLSLVHDTQVGSLTVIRANSSGGAETRGGRDE